MMIAGSLIALAMSGAASAQAADEVEDIVVTGEKAARSLQDTVTSAP
ncbi:hypothetical protein [Sphingobium sp. DC-2]|nr:hypothetical protein [Sphingobium sp. DC-2]